MQKGASKDLIHQGTSHRRTYKSPGVLNPCAAGHSYGDPIALDEGQDRPRGSGPDSEYRGRSEGDRGRPPRSAQGKGREDGGIRERPNVCVCV